MLLVAAAALTCGVEAARSSKFVLNGQIGSQLVGINHVYGVGSCWGDLIW